MTKESVKNNKKTKWIIALCVFLMLIILFFSYSEIVINPIIFNLCSAKVDSLATTAISDAIFDVLIDESVDYSDIIDVKYDEKGNVSSISSNVKTMNYLAREISTNAQIYLDEIGETGVNVHIGAFSGLEILMNFGPYVKVNTTPIGSIITVFNSEFESAGINQTKHSIYVDVNTSISIILPTSSKKIEFVTSMLVCESIIVGDVPEFYLSSDLKSSG